MMRHIMGNQEKVFGCHIRLIEGFLVRGTLSRVVIICQISEKEYTQMEDTLGEKIKNNEY